MTDVRPVNCRFRLQDEGHSYPRSSCTACNKTILTGLGRSCRLAQDQRPPLAKKDPLPPDVRAALESIANTDIWGLSMYQALTQRINKAREVLKNYPLDGSGPVT